MGARTCIHAQPLTYAFDGKATEDKPTSGLKSCSHNLMSSSTWRKSCVDVGDIARFPSQESRFWDRDAFLSLQKLEAELRSGPRYSKDPIAPPRPLVPSMTALSATIPVNEILQAVSTHPNTFHMNFSRVGLSLKDTLCFDLQHNANRTSHLPYDALTGIGNLCPTQEEKGSLGFAAECNSAFHVDLAYNGQLQLVLSSETTMLILWDEFSGSLNAPEDRVWDRRHSRYSAIARQNCCDSWRMAFPECEDDKHTSNETLSLSEASFVIYSFPSFRASNAVSETPDFFSRLLVTFLCNLWMRCPVTLLKLTLCANQMHILYGNKQTIHLGELVAKVLEGDLLGDLGLAAASCLRATEFLTKYITYPASQRIRYEPPDFLQLICLLSRHAFPRPSSELLAAERDLRLWEYLLTHFLTSATSDSRRRLASAEDFWRLFSSSSPSFQPLPLTSMYHDPYPVSSLIPARWLVSCTTRLNKLGLSWAPISPLHLPLSESDTSKGWRFYHSGPVSQGNVVSATSQGLKGVWRTFVYASKNLPSLMQKFSQLHDIPNSVIGDWEHIGLLQAASLITERDEEGDVDVWGVDENQVPAGGTSVTTDSRARAKKGRMLVVVGSNNARSWIWRGVYVWDLKDALPVFERKSLLIV